MSGTIRRRDSYRANDRFQVIRPDPKYAARGFPTTDREVAAQAFAYSLNRSTGFEQVLWDCKRWKRKIHDERLSTDGP